MKKNGQIFKRMLASYAVIICITIAISGILYWYTYNMVMKQADYYSSNLIGTVQTSCDREISYYQSFLKQLRLDEQIIELGMEESYEDPEDYWNIELVRRQLEDVFFSMKDSGMYCLDVFVYLKEIDKVICHSSVMRYELYNNITTKLGEEDAIGMREYLLQCNKGSIISIRSDNTEECILMVEPAMGIGTKKSDAVIGIIMQTEALNEQIRSIDWEGGMEWAIIDSQNRFIRKPDKLGEITLDFQTLENEQEYGNGVYINNKKYRIDMLDSDVCDWKYVLFTPAELISGTADRIRNFHLLSLIIILIVGYCVAKQAIKVTYNPLKGLLDIFNKNGEEKELENEYQYLNKQVSVLLEKYDDIKKSMSESKAAIRTYTFEKVLTTSANEEIDSMFAKDIYIKFKTGNNIILLCIIKENYNEEELIEENQLKRFIVSNVFDEGIGELFQVETQEYGENVVAIVNVPEDVTDYSEKLQNIMEKLCGFIKQNFKFDVYVLEGGCYKGISGIHRSYLEACQTEEFCNDLNETYIRYDDIKDRTVRKYHYTFEMEERVINAIRTHNAKLAVSYIDMVLENNYEEITQTSSEMLTLLLYDIFTTLVKVSEELGISINRAFVLNYISANSSLEEVKVFFHQKVEEICNKAEEICNNVQGQELCKNIMEYIRKNFTDPDLNISQTALQFHVAPVYLSSVFKKQMGKSMLDVIKQMRIEYAKELLDEGASVAEVSLKVGFGESSTFIRVFKNCTGITPNQFKKIDKKL